MAEYLTNTADLTAVADAIRAKGGTAAQLVYPSGFVSDIQAIQTGVTPQLIVTTSAGAAVTATKGSKTVNRDGGRGRYVHAGALRGWRVERDVFAERKQ